MTNQKINAALLGKIVLARFLELPLHAFERFVTRAESCAGFSALAPWVTVARVRGARAAKNMADSPHSAALCLGRICDAGGRLSFLYQREAFVREYLYDEPGLNHLKSRQALPQELTRTLHHLRLINTRNRLTHALMQAVLETQIAYLRSGEPMSLVPLTRAQVSRRLRMQPGLSVVGDESRISRLTRGLSIMLLNGKTIPLAALFPRPRQLHCHFVDHVIKVEKTWISNKILREPLTDEAIAELLAREYGIHLSRRTVADIRHTLAIPDYKSRKQRLDYLTATEGFSALMPLTPQTLRATVPAHPGVYEIRTATAPSLAGKEDVPKFGAPLVPHGVIYIGSAQNLRKRLGDHLRGNSGNAMLYRYIADGVVRVRFRLVRDGWRWVERELYRVFCETFGAPPPCNRMSP